MDGVPVVTRLSQFGKHTVVTSAQSLGLFFLSGTFPPLLESKKVIGSHTGGF